VFPEIEEPIVKLIESKGFSEVNKVGKNFSYSCEKEGMPYIVKLGFLLDEDGLRVARLKNEVAAVTALWELFPDGETKTFTLPPGPDDIFDEETELGKVYGFSRFYADGSILAEELNHGSEKVDCWIEKFAQMSKEIDSLPELKLPNSERDKQKKYEDEFAKYITERPIVRGTSHGNFTPEHILLNDIGKPYLVSYSMMTQQGPRFWDIACMYTWLSVDLNDSDSAKKFFESSTDKLDVKQIEYIRHLSEYRQASLSDK